MPSVRFAGARLINRSAIAGGESTGPRGAEQYLGAIFQIASVTDAPFGGVRAVVRARRRKSDASVTNILSHRIPKLVPLQEPSEPSSALPLAPLEALLPRTSEARDGDALLERFLAYCESVGLELYAAQEEAILEIFAERHVVLNTPTGSGKSLVALAACFNALATDRFVFYTAPIKALVTEKFFELCEKLGASNVGMMTGDATVNRDAPVICCTAEILSNLALRKGDATEADWVVMDEFHYYSDRDRGAAWQIPLLTLPKTRFVLMSATMGKPEFFVKELEARTGVGAALVRSTERPVPLDWEYKEVPLQDTVFSLAENGKGPIYIVHFSQRAASEQAQNLMSLNFLTKEEKLKIKEELKGFKFGSPFGRELQRLVPHGIGVHHAGMLPKYRRLTERLARKGLLRIICGTDTLGVGVNVPIRTVLFTQLCKFDGEKTVLLSVRDFHQIAGRAGRRGFDTQGTVVVQAPEHEIENRVMKDKAADNPKKLRKLRLKKPPERGYTPWKKETLERLKTSEPAPLVSRIKVDHGMLLSMLSRPKNGGLALRKLIRDSHESVHAKRRHFAQAKELLRSLIDAKIVECSGGQLKLAVDLQEDFSLNQTLSLYALEVFDALDKEAEDFALVLVSVIESILESPGAVLNRQVATLKTRKMTELKLQGVEYDERIAALEKIEHPKPSAEFIYETFNLFAEHHPWVIGHNVAPKSIVRDMFEEGATFNDYVRDYGLARAEGVLLRYLTDAYRTLRQLVPDEHKTEEVWDIEEWLGSELRKVDASLIDEWERLQGLGKEPEPAQKQSEPEGPEDITRNQRAFTVACRNAAWRLVQMVARRNYEGFVLHLKSLLPEEQTKALDVLGEEWTSARVQQALGPFFESYEAVELTATARSNARAMLEKAEDRWALRQIISDPEQHLEWSLELTIDLAASRLSGCPVLLLERIAHPSA